VGDGTTSVIVLAGEILDTSIIFLERNIHPTQIVMAYNKALQVIVIRLSFIEMIILIFLSIRPVCFLEFFFFQDGLS